MSDQDVDRATELRLVERRRLQALVDADNVTARQLHADDYQLITPGGAALTKSQYLDDIASGALDYRVFEPASVIAVQMFGDAGVVRYHARIKVQFGSGGNDSGLFWHTDIYRRTADGWQAVWSQATRIRE
jgi:hypothetical protein